MIDSRKLFVHGAIFFFVGMLLGSGDPGPTAYIGGTMMALSFCFKPERKWRCTTHRRNCCCC